MDILVQYVTKWTQTEIEPLLTMRALIMVTLREARLQALLSMRQLARQASVSPTTIQLLESGQHSPQLLTIYKLSRALGIEPAEIDEFHRAMGRESTVESSHEEGSS